MSIGDVDWGLARSTVRLQLCLEEDLRAPAPITWRVADGLAAVLVYELAGAIHSIRATDRETWPVTDDELYDIALENVRGEGLLESSAVDIGDETMVHVLQGSGTPFAASHALFLEDYLMNAGMAPPHRFQGEHGALIAVPHRHVLLYHPIDDLRVERAAQSMRTSAARMFAEGPASISAELYWLPPSDHDGDDVLVRLPCVRTDEALRVGPPPAFVVLLASLSAAPDSAAPPPTRSH